jgi:hypothetical protein
MFRVEFTTTPPLKTQDVDADTRDHAIAAIVEQEKPNGEVAVTRCVELAPEVEPSEEVKAA